MANQRPFDAVQFTRESAERIASVVRAAEAAPPAARPLRFDRVAPAAGGQKVAFAYWTATSDWSVWAFNGPTNTQNTKTIMFASGNIGTNTAEALAGYYATGATAMCLNNFQFIPRVSTNATAAKMLVLTLKQGGMWRLIGAQS